MEQLDLEVYISEEQLKERIAQLGETLTAEYAGKNPIIVGILKGVVVFFSDMIRQIRVPCEIGFLRIASYAGTETTGRIILKQELDTNVSGRHVLILEDIFDTGRSLDFVCKYLQEKNPASLKVCTLLDKPSRRLPGIDLKADYVGFEIPDKFVLGYGMDYNEFYRNLPYIAVVKPKV